MPEPEGAGIMKRTVREKTGDFMARYRGDKSLGGKARDMRLAFNSAAWNPWVAPYTNRWANLNGPFYADGIQISQAATGYGSHSSAADQKGIFVVYKDGTVDIIGQMTSAIAKKTWFSVPAFVYRLVTSGVAATFGDNSVRPRTTIGLSEDKKTFYVLMVDGDNDEWSPGADFTSLAKMMVLMGVYNGFNLDGGGSSNMCTWDFDHDCPMIMGRTSNGFKWSSQRDNGGNSGIYFAPTLAKIGTYNYDDLTFLVDDIADGEIPSDANSTITIVSNAVVMAGKPLPNGWKVVPEAGCTTATLGWESAEESPLASGATVTFEGVRFAEGCSRLKVASGATAVLNDVSGLTAIETADKTGFRLGTEITEEFVVDCASAKTSGTTFGYSTLDAATTEGILKNLVCDGVDTLVAKAVATEDGLELQWSKIVDFDTPTVTMPSNGWAQVTVDVSEVAPDYMDGSYSLEIVYASSGSKSRGVEKLTVTGPGTYSVVTPIVGFEYNYSVSFVNADGEKVAHTPQTTSDKDYGIIKNWFTGTVEPVSASGGEWEELTDPNWTFVATEPKNGRVKFVSRVLIKDVPNEGVLDQKIAAFAAQESFPQGAIVLGENPSGVGYAWRGLVKSGDSRAWKTLSGPVAINETVDVVVVVEFTGSAPRVKYQIGDVDLVDSEGNVWFDGPGSAMTAEGLIKLSGDGETISVAGYNVIKKVVTQSGLIFYVL